MLLIFHSHCSAVLDQRWCRSTREKIQSEAGWLECVSCWIWLQSSGFHSMVLGAAASPPPGDLLEMRVLGPCSGQKLRRPSNHLSSNKPSGGSDARCCSRAALEGFHVLSWLHCFSSVLRYFWRNHCPNLHALEIGRIVHFQKGDFPAFLSFYPLEVVIFFSAFREPIYISTHLYPKILS